MLKQPKNWKLPVRVVSSFWVDKQQNNYNQIRSHSVIPKQPQPQPLKPAKSSILTAHLGWLALPQLFPEIAFALDFFIANVLDPSGRLSCFGSLIAGFVFIVR